MTIGLVCGRDATLLIDTGTTLEEAGSVASDVGVIAGCPVTHVVLTHKHFDHVLGSSAFADAELYCAPAVARVLTSATAQLRDDAVHHGADAGRVERAIAGLRQPQHQVHDALIDLGDRTVHVSHLGAGHTRSDLVVVVPAVRSDGRTVVFTGDLVEESAEPAIDADSDVAAWPATLERLLQIGGPDAVYVPGHGSVVDAEFVRRQRRWLIAYAAQRGGDH